MFYEESCVVFGTGVKISNVDWDFNAIIANANLAPKTFKSVMECCDVPLGEIKAIKEKHRWIFETYVSDSPYYREGEAGFLCDFLTEVSGIELQSIDEDYIIFTAKMPWDMEAKEKNLSEKDISNIFKPYVKNKEDFYVEDFFFTTD